MSFDVDMNILLRQILKFGLERSARQSIHKYPQVVCFAHDGISRKIMIDGLFEKPELLALKDFLLAEPYPRETCLDIGGNIGNHALFFADLFGTVISFEPNMATFKVLSLNAELAENVSAINVGISNTKATKLAVMDPLNIGGSRISDSDAASIEFNVVTLDEYLQSNAPRPISFIKMDVEGYELEALQGASETLQKHQPMLALEFQVKKHKEKTDEIVAFLTAQGYSYAHIFKPKIFSRKKPCFMKIPLQGFENYPPKNHKMVLFTFD